MKDARNVAAALSRVKKVVKRRNEMHILHTSEISRTDREILVNTGWLQEIIKGWYLLVRPDNRPGDSSAWHTNFWDFLSIYLMHFFGEEYCLSAEQSLDLHLGATAIPKQVIVMAAKGRGAPLKLPFDTSLLIYAYGERLPPEREHVKKLQVMSLPYALCKVTPTYFQRHPRDAEIALQSIKRSDDLLRVIVKYNFVRAAGRLIGAYRFLGNQKMAEELSNGLAAVHINIQETNPFVHETPLIPGQIKRSPYAARIFALWQQYRPDVVKHFPKEPGLPKDVNSYLDLVNEQYVQDAYHSLSIEGYHVTPELIERVKNGEWSPERNTLDGELRDALAARGYYEAFLSVKESLTKVLDGSAPGEVVESDLPFWYRSIFAPNVTAGIIEPSDLFGYRRHQVYIRNSRHTPLPAFALGEAMEAFLHCLKEEKDPGVRAVLGHFVFVYIHPYMDGNGRIGRFLMNLMLGAGGYPWTIIHVENRRQYLNSLEEASAKENIVPFVKFLKSEL